VLDNTDPDTLERVMASVDPRTSLVLVMSKSGGTPETRNGLLRARQHWDAHSVPFGASAVADTQPGSELDRLAQGEGWVGRLPLWDWVGGRTSVTGPVGVLPAALVGVDVNAFLDGAARMDAATRLPPARNPAAWLAVAWLSCQEDRRRAMVMLPYADRLRSLGRYLQQLIMESLGKRLDRQGREVREGLTVYGNKGSTDQHAYVQQLRDGPEDFFAGFVEVLRPGLGDPVLESGLSAGDTLAGLLLGTRQALREDGKRSYTLTLDEVCPRSLGALIALFERTVGIVAELQGINAYHQPGVEAGKKAAARALAIQRALLPNVAREPRTVDALCVAAGISDVETAWRILLRLSVAGRGVARIPGPNPADDRFILA